MDLRTFAEAADTVTREGDQGILRRILTPIPEMIRLALMSADDEQVAGILDRLTVLAIAAVINDNDTAFKDVVGALGDYYESVAAVPDAVSLTDPSSRLSATAWRDVVVRLYLIGSFAVRAGKLRHLRTLTLHPHRTAAHYAYVSWIRHGLVSAARADVLESDPERSGQSGSKTVISRARKLAAEVPELRPDLPSLENADAGDRLLNSLCQFDIASCLIIQSAADTGHGGFYPSSAAFHQWRADPIFEAAVGDGREALLPNSSDQQVADDIETVFEVAENQSWNFGGMWTSLPGAVQLFIAQARGQA